MLTTTHYKGHRWSEEEIRSLMNMWQNDIDLSIICSNLKSSKTAILKQVQRLRNNGIPLKRRKSGHVTNTVNQQWTQGEIEYLLRRRNEKATSEEIGSELLRSPNAVDGMIQKLRREGVNVPMRGSGVKRLYNIESLKSVLFGRAFH